MLIHNLSKNVDLDSHSAFPLNTSDLLFINCNTAELADIMGHFEFDSKTIEECIIGNKNSHLVSLKGYDFINMAYFYLAEKKVKVTDIDFYISSNYLIFVEHEKDEDSGVKDIANEVLDKLKTVETGGISQNRLYFIVLNAIINRLSDTMEKIEDEISDAEKSIEYRVLKSEYLERLAVIRTNVYTIKKTLRPMLYMVDQILANENEFIEPAHFSYFKNIDIHLDKLYDFSTSLNEYSNHLLDLYDSKVASKTNDAMNRVSLIAVILTPITIISGIYGMNFVWIPELTFKYGYFFALFAMICIPFAMILYFKKNKWL